MAIDNRTCFLVASRTFNSLPRNGNTPYRSRPTTPKPATASVLAESPSVRMSVQSSDFVVPAQFASSSLGTPAIKTSTLTNQSIANS